MSYKMKPDPPLGKNFGKKVQNYVDKVKDENVEIFAVRPFKNNKSLINPTLFSINYDGGAEEDAIKKMKSKTASMKSKTARLKKATAKHKSQRKK
tara:strand:+ start:863 stop:1147 length:285 start_codon:yes stop_codon:yes gene_type:complete